MLTAEQIDTFTTTAGRLTGISPASVVAVPRPRPASTSSRRQRVGSARAWKVVVSSSTGIGSGIHLNGC